jgi:hypothetical protein
MPSQVKRFSPSAGADQNMPLSNTKDGQLNVGIIAGEGEDVSQVKINTMASSQTGNYGFRFGKDGDLIRLNAQGEAFEITGEDRRRGITLEAMPGYVVGGAEAVMEVAYSSGD